MTPADILSDIFQTMRLRSDLYFTARLSGAYAVDIPPEGKRVRFHLVREGTCWLRGDDPADPVRLEAGDLALVPNGLGHVLADTREREPVPLPDVLASGALDPSGMLTYGSDGQRVTILCGFCAFDENIRHPIFSSIPDRIVLNDHRLSTQPSMRAAVELLAQEADLAEDGMGAVLSRLLEIVFVQAMRGLVDDARSEGPAFLPALADPNLSRALRAIHLQPAFPWTTTLLAQEAGMSRTRFAVKFAAVVGDAPMGYLSNWRLSKARTMLTDTNLSVDEIGRRCGYRSLPSFTRRFKATFGEGPGSFRRDLRSQAGKSSD